MIRLVIITASNLGESVPNTYLPVMIELEVFSSRPFYMPGFIPFNNYTFIPVSLFWINSSLAGSEEVPSSSSSSCSSYFSSLSVTAIFLLDLPQCHQCQSVLLMIDFLWLILKADCLSVLLIILVTDYHKTCHHHCIQPAAVGICCSKDPPTTTYLPIMIWFFLQQTTLHARFYPFQQLYLFPSLPFLDQLWLPLRILSRRFL